MLPSINFETCVTNRIWSSNLYSLGEQERNVATKWPSAVGHIRVRPRTCTRIANVWYPTRDIQFHVCLHRI